VVIAGGSGALGLKIAANFAEMGHEVVILTRTVREAVPFQQVVWDGRTVENAWGRLVSGSLLINLSGELVDKRPTAKNIALLIRFGARFIFKTDPLLALTGRRAMPTLLLNEGFEFKVPELAQALDDLCGNQS
jgi:NAD dependent epimerase/dehydratase family enzyme